VSPVEHRRGPRGRHAGAAGVAVLSLVLGCTPSAPHAAPQAPRATLAASAGGGESCPATRPGGPAAYPLSWAASRMVAFKRSRGPGSPRAYDSLAQGTVCTTAYRRIARTSSGRALGSGS
jgi:hypothetical protein